MKVNFQKGRKHLGKALLLAATTLSLTATAQPPQSNFKTQCANKRMMWTSINNVKNASLGDYQQHTGKMLISWRGKISTAAQAAAV